jgi:phage terminase large subunit-like protein
MRRTPRVAVPRLTVELSDCALNPPQKAFIDCATKRIIVRAGRRGGKTRGVSEKAVRRFLQPKYNRILYAAPTQEQVEAFWFRTTTILLPLIQAGVFKKNEAEHIIERPGTLQRIKAKTAWNADTLRGDFADLLILDEWQLMNEDAWELVGAPMLLDRDGDAIFIYTPPSLWSRRKFMSKARDPQHAAKMFTMAVQEQLIAANEGRDPRWRAFHWKSSENGYISQSALAEVAKDMTALAKRMELDAEDVTEAPGALWTRELIERHRVVQRPTQFDRVVVAVDPSATAEGDEAGIVVGGKVGDHVYVIEDASLQGSPQVWAQRAVTAYQQHQADHIVAEQNNGGEMVQITIHVIDPTVPVSLVHASRGKQVRADPISALYQSGRVHHVGSFANLEDEMCLWLPGMPSPNRMDALVWLASDLMFSQEYKGFLEFYMGAAERVAQASAPQSTSGVA